MSAPTLARRALPCESCRMRRATVSVRVEGVAFHVCESCRPPARQSRALVALLGASAFTVGMLTADWCWWGACGL